MTYLEALTLSENRKLDWVEKDGASPVNSFFGFLIRISFTNKRFKPTEFYQNELMRECLFRKNKLCWVDTILLTDA
jgi:hypothetical protein